MERQLRHKFRGSTLDGVYLEDCMMCLLAVIMLAFCDYRMLTIIVQVVSFCVILTGHLRRNNLKISPSVCSYAVLKCIFLIWCFLSCVWSINAEHSFSQSISVGLRLLTGLSVVLYVDSRDRLVKLLKFVVFACCVFCLRLLVMVNLSACGSDRVGMYLAHDIYSGYGNTGVTYVLGVTGVYLLVFEKLFDKRTRWLLFVLFAIVSALSGSKKEIGILVIALIAYSLLKSKNMTSAIRNFLIALAAITAFMLAVFYIQPLYDVLGQRLVSFLSFFSDDFGGAVDASTSDRSAFIGYALEAFAVQPLVGIGADCFRYVNPIAVVWSECNFVELLADMGIVGFLVYYLPILWMLKKAFPVASDVAEATIVLLFVMLFIDSSMVTYASNILQFHWAVLWAVASSVSFKQGRAAHEGRTRLSRFRTHSA